ncbi:hypothetical protein O181_067776 [Austropuccinia psidii MF-1]|uniref:Uncharacterized protein n=1 Tax=Austropuccinia psidii MF-1 TaxID=1389203 RepID=A0A9Q3ETK7_9BASI|nr:hypothetical protein [Austropuccinia psidii MF-1]
MEIDRKKNFRFSECAPESGTPDSGNTDSEGRETPILGIGTGARTGTLVRDYKDNNVLLIDGCSTIHQGDSCFNHRQLTSLRTGCPPNTAYPPYARGVHSRHAPNTAYHPYACGVHSRHAPDPTSPYACVVPSRHAPNTTYPYACVVPSQHAPDTAYHPYARRVPSPHAPDTAAHPYARGVPTQYAPTPLILTLPYYIHSVQCLFGVHNERNRQNMLSGLL